MLRKILKLMSSKEQFVRQSLEEETVIIKPEYVNVKCHIKLFTFSFSERIARLAEQKGID